MVIDILVRVRVSKREEYFEGKRAAGRCNQNVER
jgi:hypothetical protein